MTAIPILTAITFLPVAGAVCIACAGERRARSIALVATLATLALSCRLWVSFDRGSGGLQFVEARSWIPAWNIAYGMGVDGIALPFLMLSAILGVLCVGVSWDAIRGRAREFYASLLVAQTAMLGFFSATNLFLFFLFWEMTLVPLFLLIGVWGGPGRVHAAMKFLLFTLAGSVLMFVGLISLHRTCGTLDLAALAMARGGIPPGHQIWLFAAFLAAFAVKVPMFPVHTWLPNAHTEAPTAGSVVLAGVLLKMGAYGFLRISIPVLPHGVRFFQGPMVVLSALAIVYGAYVTLVQTDIKRLIAYSSVSHMGFVTLGIFTLRQGGLEGAILQMINHGIVSAALFLCIGMIYARTHTREVGAYGGVGKAAPVYASFLALFCAAAMGFPGLNSFVGEFLVLGAAFQARFWLGAAAVWGVALGTFYMAWLFARICMGALNPRLEGVRLDLNAREVATLAPLGVLVVVLGLHPEAVLSCVRLPVAALLAGAGP